MENEKREAELQREVDELRSEKTKLETELTIKRDKLVM
jgi:hypothetical protein